MNSEFFIIAINTKNKCIKKYLNKQSIFKVMGIIDGIGYFREKFMTSGNSDLKIRVVRPPDYYFKR